jgi:hypothetical protein
VRTNPVPLAGRSALGHELQARSASEESVDCGPRTRSRIWCGPQASAVPTSGLLHGAGLRLLCNLDDVPIRVHEQACRAARLAATSAPRVLSAAIQSGRFPSSTTSPSPSRTLGDSDARRGVAPLLVTSAGQAVFLGVRAGHMTSHDRLDKVIFGRRCGRGLRRNGLLPT